MAVMQVYVGKWWRAGGADILPLKGGAGQEEEDSGVTDSARLVYLDLLTS